MRRLRRRAARTHSLRIRRSADPAMIESDMRTLFDLHDRRFGVLLPAERDRPLLPRRLCRGGARAWLAAPLVPAVDGEAAAAWYGWRLGDRYSYFNGGFDPNWNDVRPGFILMSAVIEAAFAEGAEWFDFLLGNEAYKARFADESRQVSEVIVSRAFPHPASALSWAEVGARRIGRSLPASARARLGPLAARSKVRGSER